MELGCCSTGEGGGAAPVIDDIVYLKGGDVRTEYRLSELLTEGCDGSHWVGNGNENAKP